MSGGLKTASSRSYLLTTPKRETSPIRLEITAPVGGASVTLKLIGKSFSSGVNAHPPFVPAFWLLQGHGPHLASSIYKWIVNAVRRSVHLILCRVGLRYTAAHLASTVVSASLYPPISRKYSRRVRPEGFRSTNASPRSGKPVYPLAQWAVLETRKSE